MLSLVQPPSDEKAKSAGIRAAMLDSGPDGASLAEIANIIDSGKLAPVINRILPLSEARRALVNTLNVAGYFSAFRHRRLDYCHPMASALYRSS